MPSFVDNHFGVLLWTGTNTLSPFHSTQKGFVANLTSKHKSEWISAPVLCKRHPGLLLLRPVPLWKPNDPESCRDSIHGGYLGGPLDRLLLFNCTAARPSPLVGNWVGTGVFALLPATVCQPPQSSVESGILAPTYHTLQPVT